MRVIRRLVVFILALVLLDTAGVIEVRWAGVAGAVAEAREIIVQWCAKVPQRMERWATEEFLAR
jgi:uncharacterized membrane protein (Fun14 family)